MDSNVADNVDRIAGAVANAVRQSLSNAFSPTTPSTSSRGSGHGAGATSTSFGSVSNQSKFFLESRTQPCCHPAVLPTCVVFSRWPWRTDTI